MRLGAETNGRSNELAMQSKFEKWISDHNKHWHRHEDMQIEYKREFTIKEIGRRADFLLIQDRRLINIELKTNPSQILIDQLIDHSKYCDYCFALVPDFCLIARWFGEILVKYGFGLIVYNHEKSIFTEALPAFKNKGRDIKLKKKYLNIFIEKQLEIKI